MHGPDQVVELVLDALAARRWDDVIRWTHPEAVQRLAHHAAREVKNSLAPRPQLDLDVPGCLAAEEREREALLREWEITAAGGLDVLSREDVLRRALERLRFDDSRDGLDARRPIGTVIEADGVAHVLIRRQVPVRYTWWGRGAGHPVVATLLFTPSEWLLYPQPGFFEQFGVKPPEPRAAASVLPEMGAHAAA